MNVEDLIPLDFFVSDDGNPMGGLAMTPISIIDMVDYYHGPLFRKLINKSVELATKDGNLVKSNDGFHSIFTRPK